MRFISLKKKSKGWLCLCIVKRWRPIYARLNARFANEHNLAEWKIVDEETYCRWTTS